MRRLRVRALAAVIPLIIPAAGSAGAAPPTKVGVAYAGDWVDGSWEAMAQTGAVEAAAEFGVKLFETDLAKPSGALRAPEKLLSQLAKRSDLVLATAFGFQHAADLAAAANPDTNFAVLGSVPMVPQSNLLGTTVANNEGSFLVGAAAAPYSLGQIGFIGGVNASVIFEHQAGFVAGVGYQDPSASVAVEYVSLLPDWGGFDNPARAYEIAMAMYGSGIGVFEAARDYSQAHATQVWAIGVDVDQYLQVSDDLKPYVLTSMVVRVDVVAGDVIASQAQGTFTGGIEHWDLSRNGVDYATSGGFIDDFVPTLESIKQDIIDGVIIVPDVP